MNDRHDAEVDLAAAASQVETEMLDLGAVSALTFGTPGTELETPATLNFEP